MKPTNRSKVNLTVLCILFSVGPFEMSLYKQVCPCGHSCDIFCICSKHLVCYCYVSSTIISNLSYTSSLPIFQPTANNNAFRKITFLLQLVFFNVVLPHFKIRFEKVLIYFCSVALLFWYWTELLLTWIQFMFLCVFSYGLNKSVYWHITSWTLNVNVRKYLFLNIMKWLRNKIKYFSLELIF
jgi:hypothetical protein